jgi:NADH-quinone oxidoreductase subunit M
MGFAAMASLGLPGLAGFWGEFPAILSAYNPGFGLSEPLFRTLMVIAAIGTVLAAGYLLWLYQRTAFGEPNPEFTTAGHGSGHGHVTHAFSSAHNTAAAGSPSDEAHGGSSRSGAEASADHHDGHDEIYDVTPIEWIAWTPFLVGIVVLGVYPQLLFKVFNPAVTELVARLGESLG